MNTRQLVPMLLIVVASVGALIATAVHPEQATASDHHHQALSAHHHELDHHDDVAVDEMLHYAATHLGTAAAIPDSYAAVPNWNASWELRWIDFHHGDHLARVYHATHHDHPETRFVIAVDDSDHATDHHWTPAQ